MEREMVEIEIDEPKTHLDPNGSINHHPHPIFNNKSIRPVSLKFEDVEYRIKAKKEGFLNKKKLKDHEKSGAEDKLILKGVTGIVYPGEMLAMLGPSGSGKTTLLTALGGRLISGCLTGHITYNGRSFSNVIKRNLGFVTQDDILYPHLTVTETLVFTALLRLPNDLTKQEKKDHVDDVINQLGLTRCKNSIIGDNLLRGVSGGERKRVSIGQEMLINPSLLLLDEPTSGLDSTTAQRILSTLKELADGGRTIVMTIHQPSSRLFYMFHKVLLLSEGNPLYFGKACDAMDYFASVGFIPLFSMNPADFLLDLANGISPDDSQDDQSFVKQKLVAAYKSNLLKKFEEQFQNQSNYNNRQEEGSTDKKSTPWTTTWCQQFSVLLQRGLKERKHESFSGLKIGQVLIVAFLTGFLWWKSNISHLQDQIGLFYFYTGFWGFYPLFEAIFTFPPERMMLEKERASGMYRLSSYFIARTTGDLPMGLILPTVFVAITYWMAGLKPVIGNFVSAILVVLLCVLVAQGMGLAIGALVMDMKKAAVLGSVLMLSFLLAGGFYVQHIPKFVSWIKYVSISNYTYKLLLLSQYQPGETYLCDNTRKTYCLVEDFPSIKTIGLDGTAMSVIAMAIMVVFYRVVAYIALMRIGATKK